ncbi:MAG: hypothetical protein ABSF27_06495 [Candidatus Dormibacteria bacterium]|jgi:hypothetical protein
MDFSSVFGSSAQRRWLLAVAIALGLALSVGVLGASSVAAKSKVKHHKTHHAKVQKSKTTAVPKSCPSVSMVAGALGQDITGVTAAPQTGSTGSKLTCTYALSVSGIPAGIESTKILFASPITSAQFAASKASAASGVTITSVPGLGNQNWIVEQGNGLSVLEGTMDIVIEAPATTDAQLEALARQIL